MLQGNSWEAHLELNEKEKGLVVVLMDSVEVFEGYDTI
jgi:hypothetical protein